MKNLFVFVIFLFFASSLLTGCLGCGNSDRKLVRQLMRMPSPQREALLATYPPERQVHIYIYGATNFEPPMLLNEIAPHWKTVVPPIKRHLESTSDDFERFQLTWLLALIGENYCSISEHSDLMIVAARATTKMSGAYKGAADEPLARIKNAPKGLPPCE